MSAPRKPGRKPVIALLAAAESTPSVLYGLYDVLASAGAVYPDMVVGAPGDALLDVRIVAASAEPFRCFGNVLVEPHGSVAGTPQVDAVVLCDMYSPITVPPRGKFPLEIEWLRRMHAQGALIGSVCSGSLVLAEAGLLDGLPCAGHWAYRDLFRNEYPEVTYCAESILNLDGEPRGVITAGGVTAWQELALYLIARYCDREQALYTAKVYLLSGHEDGQLPFSAARPRLQDADGAVRLSQTWIAEHFADANPVEGMARRSGLAARTFARRFRIATGYPPMDYVHALRIDEAKRLIERNAAPLDDIAAGVGYQDPGFFRRLFKREVGLTPAAYRRKFAGIIPSIPRKRESRGGSPLSRG